MNIVLQQSRYWDVTVIAVVKSPYMLLKGWYRLTHDLITPEGPFLEIACILIAGLTIILWLIVVVSSIVLAVFMNILIGLYASVVVYQVCLHQTKIIVISLAFRTHYMCELHVSSVS